MTRRTNSRFNALAAAFGLSLLVVSGGTAFAGEGSFQPATVASPAEGRVVDAGIGQSFVYGQAEGGQLSVTPAFAAQGAARGPAIQAQAYNTGLNG